MGQIKVLDCTLRDGGYVNDWNFGIDNIKRTIDNLEASKVEILELGFLRNEDYSQDRTVFNSIEQFKALVPKKKKEILYTLMVEVSNPYPVEMLPVADPSGPDLIRVIVWKRMIKEAYEYCKGIVEKGYKICIQPARVTQYSDQEFIDMVELFQTLHPYAIYVVDSWGTMYSEDMMHYFELADKYMNPEIVLGYHGHNNMMQAFAIAERLLEKNKTLQRDIIIDASVFGIGRGAGNLNLELIVKYLNQKFNRNYDLKKIYQVYDECIAEINRNHSWGYSVPYLITADYNCNPNFASLMQEREYNTVKMDQVINDLPAEDRIIFSKDKI